MDQVSGFVQQNSSIINNVLFLAVVIGILYVIYQYLYPAADPTYTSFLDGEADGRQPVKLQGKVPTIHTGGDFTLSFWIYIDDFNYRASQAKHLFSLHPDPLASTSVSPLVGVLTPMTNGLMVRAATVANNTIPAPGSAPPVPSSAGPDITVTSNLEALLTGQTSTQMYQSTIDSPCDVKDIALQRWVCITIVSSGRVLDVYVDGKLARSCVLDGVVNVPRGELRLSMCSHGGFGGRVSSVQMWSSQLTPDVIYGIYQQGPTQTRRDIFTDIAKLLNLNVTFTGSYPGQPVGSSVPTDPFAALKKTNIFAGLESAAACAENLYARAAY